MIIVHVHIHVKTEHLAAFREATIENARNSLQESGVMRFDFLKQQDDPSRFLLIEIYGSINDQAFHKETAHYKKWRDTVADMMAEPRTSVKYELIFPTEAETV
jgi:autoinducer 2-degrading protein